MVKSYDFYLINTIMLKNELMKVNYDKRVDLVSVPKIIQYEEVIDESTQQVFMNAFNSFVVLDYIGHFESKKLALEFYNDYEKFDQIYERNLKFFNDEIEQIADFDETSYLLVEYDETYQKVDVEVYYGHIVIKAPAYMKKPIDLKAAQIEQRMISFALLDAMFINMMCDRVHFFLEELKTPRDLTKNHQMVLSHFSQELFKLKEPKFFLTNLWEMNILNKFYEAWNITEHITIVHENFQQSVDNYAFLWNYNNQVRQQTMSLLLAILTFAAAYKPTLEMINQLRRHFTIFQNIDQNS